MGIDTSKTELIYKALIEVATSSTNFLPGGLGEPHPPMPDLKKMASDLCDAFEVVKGRESSWIQGQQ